MKSEHLQLFETTSAQYPVNDYLFADSTCFPESDGHSFFQNLLSEYEAEVKLYKKISIFSYGPPLKENMLVPKVTFWSENAIKDNISWGLVSHQGFLNRGQTVETTWGKVTMTLEGDFDD